MPFSRGDGKRLGHLEATTIAIIAAILVYQLFIPPTIGLADNGDFSRIMGAVGLEYTTSNREDRHFNYFVPTYKFESSDEWDALVPTSENVLVLCAMAMNRLGSKTGLFDVRVLGALHVALFLLAVWLLLRLSASLDLATRVVVSLLLVLVFCDVGYVAYFNSLYSEPGSFVFLFLALAAAIHLAKEPASLARVAAWLAASLLFLSAKPQNSLLGIPLAGYGFWIAYSRLTGGGRRRVLVVSSVALCLVSVAHHWSAPRWLVKYYLYNSVFFELLKYSPTPREDLRGLGLNPDLEKYKGTNIFSAGIPVEEPEFEAAFFNRINTAKLARFYLGHPSRLAGVAQRAAQAAFSLRPSYLGNFEKSRGLAPRAQSQTFQLWSKLRESAAPRSAWFVGAFFMGNAMAALAVYVKTGSRHLRAVIVLHLVVVLMAIEQLLVTEAACGQYELVKHLFLFNLLFDLCVCADVVLATAWLSSLHFRRAVAPGAGPAG
ncbi:MAG: hypothetical protein ABSD27_02540 [Bryobacteraceae bacterium]|jgi:hypothetical protein